MRAQLRKALSGPPSSRAGIIALAIIGVALAVPFAACRFLPLVDFPVHQLEIAIAHGRSVDGTPFDDAYALAPPWLPYWMPVWLARAFIPLFGLSLASRMPVALYAGLLPLVVGLLCVVTRRSPWFALLIVPFVYDDNLSSGFFAYCLGVLLFVACIAWTFHIEAAPKLHELGVLFTLSIALGFTHPQMVLPAFAGVLGIVVLGSGRRKLLIAAAAAASAVPLVVWASQPSAANFRTGEGIVFLPPAKTTLGLAQSFDLYTENTEALFFALFIGVLVLAWLAREETGHWREHRVALIAFGALVSAYVLPFAWNGQMVSLRMLLPLLALLPATTPPACIRVAACGSRYSPRQFSVRRRLDSPCTRSTATSPVISTR